VPLTPLARYGISLSGAALAAGGVSGQRDCFAYDEFPAFPQRTRPAKLPGIRKPLYPWELLVQSPWGFPVIRKPSERPILRLSEDSRSRCFLAAHQVKHVRGPADDTKTIHGHLVLTAIVS
jgi:hypothetical protein